MERLRQANPVNEIVKILDRAHLKLGTSYEGTFQRFIEFGIGTMQVAPSQLAWDEINKDRDSLSGEEFILAMINYNRMLEHWHKVTEGLKDDTIEAFGLGVAILNKYANDFLRAGMGHVYYGPDLIGEIYMNFIVGHHQKKYKGQFFTPWNVCFMMAKVLGVGEEERRRWREEGKILSVYEPCAGSGVMMLAFFQVLRTEAPEIFAEGGYFAKVVDIDYLCIKMCELNFLLYKIPHTKINADGTYTQLVHFLQTDSLLNPNGLPPAELEKWYAQMAEEKRKEDAEKKAAAAFAKKPQLKLFDDTPIPPEMMLQAHVEHRKAIDPKYRPVPAPKAVPGASQMGFDFEQMGFVEQNAEPLLPKEPKVKRPDTPAENKPPVVKGKKKVVKPSGQATLFD
jgi:hypothetical protein